MPDWIDALVDEQLAKRPDDHPLAQACGVCHAVWFGDPVCPYCGKGAA